MATELDLLVLGGGCAGLSLALRLAEQPGLCQRVTVLESRPAYRHDRSWCFWRTGPHRYEPLVKRCWQTVALRSQGRVVQVDCSRTPYQLLEAGDFYRHAVAATQASPAVQLQLGVRVVGSPQPVADGWRVETTAGCLTARRVIDTRPPMVPRLGNALLWQSFLGHEVVCDRRVFNSGQVELMDFTDEVSGAVAFTYLLPLTGDRALIETTFFDPRPHTPADLAQRQQRAVQQLCAGAAHAVVRTESGILPMGMAAAPAEPGPGHWRVGLMSGAARPATGYAFQRIQRWADDCSAALRHGCDPAGHAPDPLLTRFMDRLFLDVLRRNPERGPELFLRLFGRVPTARIVRFLSDHGTLWDRAAVAAALPTGLFLGQLLRSVPRGMVRTQLT